MARSPASFDRRQVGSNPRNPPPEMRRPDPLELGGRDFDGLNELHRSVGSLELRPNDVPNLRTVLAQYGRLTVLS